MQPEKDNLTDQEIEEAKNNGFIIIGKTGTGKTTLLNALFNKIVGEAKKSAKAVTKNPCVYYYRLKNGKTIALIDTPGLGDDEKIDNENIDKIHLEEITKLISKEKIHLKGILFLVSFQKERFDAYEQEILINYNKIFPLKDFWKSIVIIYTHFYADPCDEEDEETMIKNKNINNGEIFSKIMDKVKNVSDVISYYDLKIKYFNSFSVAKNTKMEKNNKRTREELEVIFNELIKKHPLFHKVKIQNIKNHKWKEENGKEYFGEVEIIRFYDFNEAPLGERTNIISKEEIKKEPIYYSPPSYSYSEIRGTGDNNGGIKIQEFPTKGLISLEEMAELSKNHRIICGCTYNSRFGIKDFFNLIKELF